MHVNLQARAYEQAIPTLGIAFIMFSRKDPQKHKVVLPWHAWSLSFVGCWLCSLRHSIKVTD